MFIGPTWVPPGSCRPQIGPMLAQWNLLSGSRTVMSTLWGIFHKDPYEFLNLRALKIAMLYKNYIPQCMGAIFCVEFQRGPYPYIERFDFYKKNEILRALRFKSPEVFLKRPQAHAGDGQAATSFMTACTYIWAPFQYKDRLSRGGDFHDRDKRSWDCLIFIMGIPILARQRFYIDSPHCSTCWYCCAYKFPCSFYTQLKEKKVKCDLDQIRRWCPMMSWCD